MTDPEADTRGVEPATDEEVSNGRSAASNGMLTPYSNYCAALIARIDAEVAKRRASEYLLGVRVAKAEAEVQRLTRERDLWREYAELLGKAETASAGFLHAHGQSVAPELVAEGQRLRDAIAAAALDREGEDGG